MSNFVNDLNSRIASTFEQLNRLSASPEPAQVIEGASLLESARLAVDMAKRTLVRSQGPVSSSALARNLDASEQAAGRSILAFMDGISRKATESRSASDGVIKSTFGHIETAEVYERAVRQQEQDRAYVAAHPGIVYKENSLPPAPASDKSMTVLMQEIQVATQQYKMLTEYASNGARAAGEILIGLTDVNLVARGFMPVDAAFQGAIAASRRSI